MIEAGGKKFKTKQTLINYCKYVLNNADIDSFLEGEWFNVINDVLKMHDCYQGKTKNQEYKLGVRQCFINPKNRQFFIESSDGSDTDFSYYKALTSTSKQTRIKQALRSIIKDQVIDFKDNYFLQYQDKRGYVICPETNLKISKKSSHVDHYPVQFDELVKSWFEENNLDSQAIELNNPGDNGTAWIFKDVILEMSFYNYHLDNAKYRVVLDKVNLQRKKAKRSKI